MMVRLASLKALLEDTGSEGSDHGYRDAVRHEGNKVLSHGQQVQGHFEHLRDLGFGLLPGLDRVSHCMHEFTDRLIILRHFGTYRITRL